MATQFTNHDREMLEIIRDPAKWAAHHLGESPRWYQEQILRHPHHRKVLRCGRRIGKCIEETQRVLDPATGEYWTVEELFKRQKDGEKPSLITLNEKYQLDPSEAFFVEDNGVKDTFLVRTKYGAEVILTGNHPVLTLDGWVEVDALQKGMRIATPSALPYFGNKEYNEDSIKFAAYIVAGGHWNGSQLTFSAKSSDILEDFMAAAKALGIDTFRQVNKANTCAIRVGDKEVLKDVINKRIPKFVFSLKKEQVALFLNRMYAVNGWAYNGSRPEIGFATVSKKLAQDIKHLLLRFGIQTNLQTKRQKYKDNINFIYQLMAHRRESLLIFSMDIGILGLEESINDIYNQAEKTEIVEHTVPVEVWKHIEEERREKKLSKAQVSGSKEERLRTGVAPTISKIRKYADNLQSAFLYDLARADVIWEEVTDIQGLGKRQTYDVFVPETHNLVVEDVLVHNTWTMTAHMLWVAFTCNGGTETKKGATCLVATPYDTQAREIFDQLNNFISNNPVLQAAVASIRRSPYEIVFKNKSRIKLYTAGTRSGAEGGSLRGQKASWLYMDEVDYLSDKDFEAIYAITLEAPDRIGVMVASTPTGRRGKFFQICMQEKMNQVVKAINPGPDAKGKFANQYDIRTYDRTTAEGWEEFYFPTMVNPGWSPKMERELRNLYTQIGYEHEVLAEFGTELVGVFNKDYVDEASSNGYALLSRPMSDAPISIGIDWDKFGNATQIVVTQWNPFLERRPRPEVDGPGMVRYGRFQVINRIEIPKGEFTYDNAVRKVIELDKIYSPFAIYPDRGAGEYQIELLRKALGDKVQGVHLGGSYMVRDPYSREFDKKPIKPFLVNQTTLILERGQLLIPSKEVDEVIQRQMTNYNVERVSPKTGEPTYTNVDEHALDAMMLSIFAFIDRMPEIAKTIEDVQPAKSFGFADVRFIDPLGRIYNGFNANEADKREYIERWDEPGPPPPRRVNRQSAGTMGSFGSRGGSSRSSGLNKRRSW